MNNMNKRTLGLMALLFMMMFMTAMVLNDVKSENIPVAVDETCTKILEETAVTIDGVIQAEWNDETQELEVVYDGTKTDIDIIESAIVESGFETRDSTALEGQDRKTLKKCDTTEKKNSVPALRRNAKTKATGN
jgi:cation transport ATPase